MNSERELTNRQGHINDHASAAESHPAGSCHNGRYADGSTRWLSEQGLIERVPLDGRDRAAELTERGGSLLEAHHRERDRDHRQTFYKGADRARERTHEAQLYRAYLKEAERLRNEDACIFRVQLDREPKRDYQRFLQERNHGDRDNDGRPDRSREEVEEWARDHGRGAHNESPERRLSSPE